MKIDKQELKEIIRSEVDRLLNEVSPSSDDNLDLWDIYTGPPQEIQRQPEYTGPALSQDKPELPATEQEKFAATHPPVDLDPTLRVGVGLASLIPALRGLRLLRPSRASKSTETSPPATETLPVKTAEPSTPPPAESQPPRLSRHTLRQWPEFEPEPEPELAPEPLSDPFWESTFLNNFDSALDSLLPEEAMARTGFMESTRWHRDPWWEIKGTQEFTPTSELEKNIDYLIDHWRDPEEKQALLQSRDKLLAKYGQPPSREELAVPTGPTTQPYRMPLPGEGSRWKTLDFGEESPPQRPAWHQERPATSGETSPEGRWKGLEVDKFTEFDVYERDLATIKDELAKSVLKAKNYQTNKWASPEDRAWHIQRNKESFEEEFNEMWDHVLNKATWNSRMVQYPPDARAQWERSGPVRPGRYEDRISEEEIDSLAEKVNNLANRAYSSDSQDAKRFMDNLNQHPDIQTRRFPHGRRFSTHRPETIPRIKHLELDETVKKEFGSLLNEGDSPTLGTTFREHFNNWREFIKNS